jgi:PAS domain S-box-containing protein
VSENVALLAAIVASTTMAIVSTDLDGVVTTWNDGAESTYGFRASEAVGRRFDVVLPSIDAGRARAWQRAAAGDPTPPVEVERIRKDARAIVVEECLSAIRGGAGDVIGVSSVGQDVTARHDVKEALAATRRELERNLGLLARSNAELEQLAYVASHDLAEPLRAVSGMVQLLDRRYRGQLDDIADEYIAFAVDGCQRMQAMIDDILAYASAGLVEAPPVPVDLGAVARDVVVALARPIAMSGADVRIGELPVVDGAESVLRPLLEKLVSNAVKFHRPGAAPTVSITSLRRDSCWQVSVEDDGIGFDPQFDARVFRMFQRLHTRDAFEGTGVGLAIAQRLVHGLGGQLWVEHPATGGARFYFTIPDRADDAADEGTRPR